MKHDILLLVFADDKDEAVSLAEFNLKKIIENDQTFDYGSIVNEGELGPVRATSSDGETRITVAIERTEANFLRILRKIRDTLRCSLDTEIWERGKVEYRGEVQPEEDTLLDMFRYNCLYIGRSSGRYTHIYDPDALGIRSPVHLKNVLGGWGDQARADQLWVFVADVRC